VEAAAEALAQAVRPGSTSDPARLDGPDRRPIAFPQTETAISIAAGGDAVLHPRLLVVLALVVAWAPQPSAQAPGAAGPPDLIGILSFDAVTSEGYSATVSRGLANMLRAQVQLIDPADGAIVDTFEVEAKSSSFSGGSNVWTEIGRLNFNNDDWVRTPVGKALREAALEIIEKVVERERQEVQP
jgi:hypothetical protein